MKGQTMQAYLNSPDLKTRFLAEIAKHEAQDAIVQGTYGDIVGQQFRGCAVGCSLHSMNLINGAEDPLERTSEHERYEPELGLPAWLAYIEDHIFEHLPIELATTWPRRFAEAIPVGAVVGDIVLAKILRWMLADPEFGVRYATDVEEVRAHIDGVIAGFDAEIATNCQATAEQREAAARAARAARDARAARAARDAWDAWDGINSSRSGSKAAAFDPSLSELILAELRALPVEISA